VIKRDRNGEMNGRNLEIEVEYDEGPFAKFGDWWCEADNIKEFGSVEAREKLTAVLNTNLDSLKSYIETWLRNNTPENAHLVLSGTGYFTMHNPTFTTKGDLLVEIKYNGIQDLQGAGKESPRTALNGARSNAAVAVPAFASQVPVSELVNAKVAGRIDEKAML